MIPAVAAALLVALLTLLMAAHVALDLYRRDRRQLNRKEPHV